MIKINMDDSGGGSRMAEETQLETGLYEIHIHLNLSLFLDIISIPEECRGAFFNKRWLLKHLVGELDPITIDTAISIGKVEATSEGGSRE